MNKKYILGLVLVGIVAITALFFPKYQTSPIASGTSSTSGTVNNTAKIASIAMALSTGTSSSILNTDATDRIVESGFYSCDNLTTVLNPYNGAGLAALSFEVATTSAAASSATAVTNGNAAFKSTVATSSSYGFVASSTYAVPFPRVWAAGSYMTFWSNATTTASCTIGLHYINS